MRVERVCRGFHGARQSRLNRLVNVRAPHNQEFRGVADEEPLASRFSASVRSATRASRFTAERLGHQRASRLIDHDEVVSRVDCLYRG